MKKSSRKFDLSVNTEMQFTVTPAPFQASANLKYLDLAKLRTGKGRLELGEYVGSCCPTKLFAVVERGTVVRLELEKRKGATAPPPFLEPALVAAIKKLREREPDFTPTPVDEFLKTMARDDNNGGGPTGNTVCFFIDWDIPFVRRVVFGCCVTYHRESDGTIKIDRVTCGDPMASQY